METKIAEIIEREFSDILYLFHSKEPIQTALYQYISEQYEAITGEATTEDVSEDQCKRIWTWYYNTYFQTNTKGKQGLSRSISRVTTQDTYHFDTPYKDKQFCSNMLNQNSVEQEFIKHICTAFKLDQDSCNDCLTTYGHLPLHSKNLHDLAIYSVLTTIDETTDNPLLLVKERYFKACELVRKKPTKSSVITAIETQLLTKEIESAKQFDEKKFFSYVNKNAAYLNWRHSAILDEHKRLVTVFQYLYDIQQKGSYWSTTESNYSLFSFVNRFCKKISHQDFGERLISEIQRDGKKSKRENRHPTREIMIILWLYESCFRGSERLLCPPKYTASISPNFLKKADFFGEDRVEFDIHNYLFGKSNIRDKISVSINGSNCAGELIFDGAKVRWTINEKLTHYGYSVLSSASSCFDKIIMKLLTLKIYHASPRVHDQYTGNWNYISSYYCEFCGSDPIDISDDYSHIIENNSTYHIPLALAMFFEILNYIDELKFLNFSLDTQNKTKKELHQAQYLLACDLGRQI